MNYSSADTKTKRDKPISDLPPAKDPRKFGWGKDDVKPLPKPKKR